MIDRSATHYASVLIAQARAFRIREQAMGWDGSFSALLLNGAGNARRSALTAPQQQQRDLFAE